MRYIVLAMEQEHLPIFVIEVPKKTDIRSVVHSYYQTQGWSSPPERLLIAPLPEQSERKIIYLTTLHSPFS